MGPDICSVPLLSWAGSTLVREREAQGCPALYEALTWGKWKWPPSQGRGCWALTRALLFFTSNLEDLASVVPVFLQQLVCLHPLGPLGALTHEVSLELSSSGVMGQVILPVSPVPAASFLLNLICVLPFLLLTYLLS